MKKKSILSFFALLALTACNGSGTSSNSSSSVDGTSEVTSSESSNSVGEETSSSSSSASSDSSTDDNYWSSDVQKLMKDNLHGEILPFLDIGEFEAEFDGINQLTITGGSVLNQDDLKKYAELYSSNNGWYDTSSQYGDDRPEYVYFFEKKVQTEQGDRYVDVQFNLVDVDTFDFAESGVFYLVALDPYDYEFPKDFFDEVTQMYGSELSLPIFDADYYILMEDYFEVYCHTSSENAEQTYKATLGQNNYTLLDEENDDGYCSYLSLDKAFTVLFTYYSNTGVLDIIVTDPPLTDWPSVMLDSAFKKYYQDTFEVPPMSFDNAVYNVFEDSLNYTYYRDSQFEKINFVIEVNGASQDNFNTYLNDLNSAQWVLDETVSNEASEGTKIYTKVIQDKIAKIDVSLESNMAVIRVYLFMQDKPMDAWPSEKVKAELNNEYISDEVPSPTDENVTGYLFHEAPYMGHAYVEMLCASSNVENVFNAYVTLLATTNKWTSYGDDVDNSYLSPNKEIVVEVEKTTSSILVYFYEASLKSWPENVVNKEFEKHQYSDELPKLEGENLTFDYSTTLDDYPNGFRIEVTPDDNSNTNAATLMEQYEKALESKQFIKNDRDDVGVSNEKIYSSPNKQYDVELWVDAYSNKTLYILIVPSLQSNPA